MKAFEKIMRLYINHAHPNLFKGIVLKAFISGLWGLFLLVGPPDFVINAKNADIGRVVPLQFWGLVFLLIAGLLIFGISGEIKRFKWARRGLILGAAIGSMFAIGFWFALFGGRIYGVGGPIFWTYYTFNFMIFATEPTFNPISAVARSNHIERVEGGRE